MTDMQHNPEGENSFNQMPGHTPDDASDDTVAFAQVEQNQVDNQSADNDEKTLAENLGEVAFCASKSFRNRVKTCCSNKQSGQT